MLFHSFLEISEISGRIFFFGMESALLFGGLFSVSKSFSGIERQDLKNWEPC